MATASATISLIGLGTNGPVLRSIQYSTAKPAPVMIATRMTTQSDFEEWDTWGFSLDEVEQITDFILRGTPLFGASLIWHRAAYWQRSPTS
ncbi:hypothetical protein BGZ75_000401 [Mortierella antarctica]|nr:hypothetical protein BGZ75_000401 [Mortierella antarctica]